MPRPLLVVGGLRLDAHFRQVQADLAPDILSPVQRGDIHIAAPVERPLCRLPALIRFKQVELAFRADARRQPQGQAALLRLL